jgi:hypothetical protein
MAIFASKVYIFRCFSKNELITFSTLFWTRILYLFYLFSSSKLFKFLLDGHMKNTNTFSGTQIVPENDFSVGSFSGPILAQKWRALPVVRLDRNPPRSWSEKTRKAGDEEGTEEFGGLIQPGKVTSDMSLLI